MTSLGDSGNTLESYSYLGLATIVKRAHPQSGVDLSYIKLTGESVGDAGDQYTGLDRFGRIVDHRWINGSNVDLDRYKYGYDRNGNRLFRENVVLASLSEVTSYDDLNQIASYKLGTLNTGKTDVTGTPTNAQSWDYDAVGNWDSVTTNSTTQSRGANRQNEITSVSGATTPTFDNNGNLTKDENDNRFVWDAWNMMVQVKNASNVIIVTMGRDALHRHVTDTEGTSLKDRFFGLQWQVFENKAGSNTVTRLVWSPAYVDGMVLRDRDTDSNGTMDERLYSLQDANWNTTGLVNPSGTVIERDTYTPFGVVTFRDASGSALSGSSKDWVFLHQGGEKIAAGYYEFRNRVYSPTLGRWLSNDPIGFSAGDLNLYRYVGNGPDNRLDPTGEIWPLLVVGGMALGWLLADPPPAQAPTEPGETVVPPPKPVEKVAGVALGAGTGLIAVGVVEGGTVMVGGITKIIRGVPSTPPRNIPQTIPEVNLAGRIRAVGGSSLKQAGEFFGWQRGHVTKGPADFTRESLLAKGWTKERLLEVAEAYKHIARITPGNPSAAGRAAQLQEIIAKLFGK